jgi:calcium-dependent protein kinase
MSGDYSGSACDLWSIGVITYMLLSNKKPFWGASPKETIAQVRKGEVKFEGRSWKNISDAAKDFILKLLKKIPSERLTAKKALAHPFIRDRTKLSTEIPDPELLDKIKGNIVRYADSSDFKKIALQVIARRSTSEEIFELRNLFIEADKSQDGTLSLSEFKDALSQLNYSADEIESIFSKIDVNQTGNILYTEFLAATLEARGNIDMHKMAEAFQQLDVTETGYIEKADLQKLLPKNIKEEEMEKLIADVDADGDGRISFQEFTKAFTDETHSKISQLYTDKKTSAP